MTWVRYYSKKIFGPYMGHMDPNRAQKYMNVARMLYFFSVSTLAIFLYGKYSKAKQDQLEKGIPVIKDFSAGHEKFRKSNHDFGTFYTYRLGEGLKKEEFTKEEYYAALEKDALERAKEAQRKALAEGRELSPDAIRLV